MSPQARRDGRLLSEVPEFRESIVKLSVRDVIGDKIASMIASGVIQVGDTLPSERELASALNVSRESVRGAIQSLAARGIVEVSHGARTRVVGADVSLLRLDTATVRSVDDYDLDTVHSARMFAEREVIGDAARHIDGRTLDILDALIGAQRTAVSDPVRFLISDREFHLVVYHSARNRLLADFASDLYGFMLNHRRNAVARPGAIETSIDDHEAIVAALRAHDPEAAIAAIGVHTERILLTTRSVLETRPAS